ncbi:hypothetical protein M9H77_05288 [Catharanthus roseus]|uniref:Uncharacterized protein n=1 Tax=Catharanthus roseus TaxID=4058 RepID=A0ACC0CGN6_CATRO|nr:hypothetical protein M9H77_05288 [Catharanthus roseus]
MGCLVAKQPNALFPPINKGTSNVERLFRRHSKLEASESSLEALPKSSQTKVFLKIKHSRRSKKASTALQSINHPQNFAAYINYEYTSIHPASVDQCLRLAPNKEYSFRKTPTAAELKST